MNYVSSVAAAFNSLNNYTQDPTTCTNLTEVDMDTFAWNLQICSELPMPITSLVDFYEK